MYSISNGIVAQEHLNGEIVDIEWSGRFAKVIYSPAVFRVHCTAFNSSGKAIDGGASYAVSSVARILIQIPKKYAVKDIKIECYK